MSKGRKAEPTLGDLVIEVWRARVFVLCGLGVGFLLALAFMFSALPHYRAVMILSPASPMGAVSARVTADRNGAEAYGDSRVDDGALFTRFEAMYKGASVAALLLHNEVILEGLERDRAFIFSEGELEWNAAKLSEYIARRVVVDPVGETDLRQFYYDHVDPKFAAIFVQQIHEVTDGLIRYSMRRDVNERIEYLHEALGGVNNPEHRRGLTDLLMEQERLKMLVSINQAYAASVVEPSIARERAIWPSRGLVFAAFMGIGAFLGFVVYSVRHAGLDARIVSDNGRSAHDLTASRALAKKSTRKMRDWVRRDSGNNNRPDAESFSSSNVAE